MSFLKRWRASKTNLVGPDFDKADWLEIDLSGTKIKFKNPPLSAMIPFKPPITQLDIYSKHAVEEPAHEEELSMSRALCDNGWNYYSGLFSDSAVGGLVFDLVLIKATSIEPDRESIFHQETFINWVLKQEKSILDYFNNRKRKQLIKNNTDTTQIKYFRYPEATQDITSCMYNNHLWLKYSLFNTDDSETFVFRTAISDEYLLSISLEPSCYHDDIESPAHNLQEMVNKAIEDLMQSMHITLSPESQEQFNRANTKQLNTRN